MTESESRKRVVVIGGGPGGYPAAFFAAEAGLDVTLVNDEAELGGTCLIRGCIPSKALLHVAALIEETRHAADWGLRWDSPEVDLERLRGFKNSVVSKMTRGLGTLVKQRKVKLIAGRGTFVDAHTLSVAKLDGTTETVSFDYAVIATGSTPTKVPGLDFESPKMMDSTAALELADVPESLLVVGGGYIGLEMGSVYAALGSKVTVVEMTSNLLPGADRDLVDPLAKALKNRF
ncbi:MAG TPA: NAD(P)/FAD-dependent oxidoreductase, partial [Tepidiformaceae bacterium]|nr:NAD(P)/FAD-dependent oxidoreductase [Tepidiformaceae bacterium]